MQLRVQTFKRVTSHGYEDAAACLTRRHDATGSPSGCSESGSANRSQSVLCVTGFLSTCSTGSESLSTALHMEVATWSHRLMRSSEVPHHSSAALDACLVPRMA